MTKNKSAQNWFSRGKEDADRDIPRNERIVGVGFFFASSVFVLVYFGFHQFWSTGFFTSMFGIMEMVMLYGSWICWIITSGLEGVFGQRLLSRLFDTLEE